MRISRPVLRERGGEIPPRYSPAIDQDLVECEQRGRLDERTELCKPAWRHEQRRQAEHEAINGS